MKGSSSTPSPNASTSAIRILILDRFYFPDEQATSVYLTELTRALQDQFDFEILCGPPSPQPSPLRRERGISELFPLPFGERDRVRGIKIIIAPSFQFPKRILFTRALNDLSFLVMALVRGLFVRKPDVLVTQTSPPLVWWVGFLLSRWHRARWVHISKDVFPDNLKVLNGWEKSIFIEALGRMDSFLLKKAGRILVIGDDMREKFLKKGFRPGQIVRTCDWVDLEFIRPLPKTNPFSEKHEITDKFVVLYAGNLGRTHNFEDLLGAAEKLKDCREIVFLVVGEGALKKRMIREVQYRELTNVLIVPFEPRSKIPEVLASSDLSVILLRKGMAGLSVPSKIYSILASARPILACVEEESDIAKMVRKAGAGFVIPPGHSGDFAGAVISVFEKSDFCRELGMKARRYAEKEDFRAQAFRDYAQVFRETAF